MERRFLVTGAQGCIGAWVVKDLVELGETVTVLDIDTVSRRLRQIAPESVIARAGFVRGDVSDPQTVCDLVGDRGITHIVHLAALQIPACQADPIKGAHVNVMGTLAVFEAARVHAAKVQRIVYSSSAAVFGREDMYTHAIMDDAPLSPVSHYGVYKQANEGNARVYWRNHHVSSIGLRPLTVYGPGRDQG
jgi:nucleoside-diphosphate-sugar epimerase